jgi:hypothetical protein
MSENRFGRGNEVTNIVVEQAQIVPVEIDAESEHGAVRCVATVEGVGVEWRLYYDIFHTTFYVVMWPIVGNMRERGAYLRTRQEVAAFRVPEGPGGYFRAWSLALRGIVEQTADELMEQAFVGVVAPHN